MIIETMPIKTIPIEIHDFVFNGFTYTIPGETFNTNTYVRPTSIQPNMYILPIPIKTNALYKNTRSINALCTEGLPKYIQYTIDRLNFESLADYSYVTAIPDEVNRINNEISKAKSNYKQDFLTLVESC